MVNNDWTKSASVDWKKIIECHALHVPMKNFRRMLRDETLADQNTKKRFDAWSRGEVRDVRFEADTRIASEMDRGFVPDYNTLDLYDISNEADNIAVALPDKAEKIYMGLCESLGIHINSIDDSYGTFWPLFEECIESIGKCIKRQDISTADRHWRIEYHTSWSLVVFEDFMPSYEKLLTDLCTNVEDFNVWKGMLEYVLESDDIEKRECYWAVNKKNIEDIRKYVIKKIAKLNK